MRLRHAPLLVQPGRAGRSIRRSSILRPLCDLLCACARLPESTDARPACAICLARQVPTIQAREQHDLRIT
eukprot:782883-Alexandrium_andersonii.AAC.1